MSRSTDSPYDAGLPILAELEQLVRAQAVAADEQRRRATAPHQREHHGAPTASPRTPFAGLRRSARDGDARGDHGPRRAPGLVRRGLVLALLACTIGTTATALTLGRPEPADDLHVAARGAVGGTDWRVEVRRNGRDVCPAVVVGGSAVATDCVAAPDPAEVVSSTARIGERAVVGGVAGRDVLRVRVRVGGSRRVVPTRPVADADGLRSFGVAVRSRSGPSDVEPEVQPLGADRRALGPTITDCSATRSPSCRP